MLFINILFVVVSLVLLGYGEKLLSFCLVIIAQLFFPQWDMWLHSILSLSWILLFLLLYIPDRVGKEIKYLFGIYAGIILFLCFFSDIPIFRSMYTTITMIFSMAGLAFMLPSSVTKKEDLTIVIYLFGGITLLSSVYSIYCVTTLSNPYMEWMSRFFPRVGEYAEGFSDDIRLFTARITGIFVHPLVLGEFSLLAFCLLLIVASKDRFKYLYYIVLLLTVVSVFLSGTRSCILSLLLFLIIYYSSYINKLKLWITSLLLVIPLAYYGYTKLDSETRYLINASVYFWDESKSNNISGSSVSLRENQMKTLLNEPPKVLAVGHGPGFITYSTRMKMRVKGMAGYESIIFSKIAEEGIVGLFLFFFVVFGLYKYTVRNSSAEFKRKVLAYYLSYIVCILMTNIQGTGHVFFMGCSMLIAYKKYILNEHRELVFKELAKSMLIKRANGTV